MVCLVFALWNAHGFFDLLLGQVEYEIFFAKDYVSIVENDILVNRTNH